MKKQTQLEVNSKVEEIYSYCMTVDKWGNKAPKGGRIWNEKRLHHCNAIVIVTDYGYYLKSYSSIIAFIPAGRGVCYDFLRYVYGYTATSAQHIAKFAHDYGNGTILSWKEV